MRADDYAAATAAGGIVLRKEARISMERERLAISPNEVTVDFWFRNETDKAITTEVAFPVPPYRFIFDDIAGPRDFADFRLWVDGRRIKYSTQLKALIKGVDYAGLLRGMGIDAATFGKYDWVKDPPYGSPQINQLSAAQRQKLVRLGLIDSDPEERFPQWTVVKTYYWRQVFPAHALVHIRHKYKPVAGYEMIEARDVPKQLPAACVDPSSEERLRALASQPKSPYDGWLATTWVKYILTTANSWKTPIGKFELVVNPPRNEVGRAEWLADFCWDGKLQRLGRARFIAKNANFIPRRELTVYFFRR